MASARDTTLYEELGLTSSASTSEIRRSYRQAALRWHPDRNPHDPLANERFQACLQAYEILSNPTTRAAYDQGGLASVLPSARAEQQQQQQQQQQQRRRQQHQQRRQREEAERWRQQQRRLRLQRLQLEEELRLREYEWQMLLAGERQKQLMAAARLRSFQVMGEFRGEPYASHGQRLQQEEQEGLFAQTGLDPWSQSFTATASWTATDPSTGTRTTTTTTSSRTTASFSISSVYTQSFFG